MLCRLVPSILTMVSSCLQYILLQLRLMRPEKRKITILNKVSSILTPGRTTLLLGPPGGGKVCFCGLFCGYIACLTAAFAYWACISAVVYIARQLVCIASHSAVVFALVCDTSACDLL